MTEPLRDVLAEVAEIQRDQLRHADVLADVRIRAATWPGRHRARRWLVLPALVACAGAATIVFLAGRPAPLTFAVGDPSSALVPGRVLEAAADAALPVDFSDGSRVSLAPGARLEVEALAVAGATLTLEHGRADVHVNHRQDTRWTVKAGPARVTVTGTRFSIAWDPAAEELAVEMHEGTVIVADAPGSTSLVRLRAGQTLRASRRRGTFEIVDAASASAGEAPGVLAPSLAPGDLAPPDEPLGSSAPQTAPLPLPRARAEAAPSSSSLATFRALAARTRWTDALRAAERAGFTTACQSSNADDVVLLGDVARLAGAPERAEQAYRAALRRFPDADRAVFALGLTEFDQRHLYADAAAWFETYLRQFPRGALAREAAGRLIESRQRAGDNDRARQAASSYLARYPSGPHATLARQILGP